jgi:hypothetical protein
MTSLNTPPNLTISFYLLKNCKLWIWDFDDTLIDSTTYLMKKMTPEAIRNRTDKELDKEVPQWRYFRNLIEFLSMHGRYVGIASFGTYEIIQAYMDRIMGYNQHFFSRNNIIAPKYGDREERGYKLPPNKNEYIYTLMRKYRIEDFRRVVLFDDMASNVSEATAIGVIAIQVPSPRNGDFGSELYFGPWLMVDFDKKIETDCGKEIYLNRTFTGVSNKGDTSRIPYKGSAYDLMYFGYGAQEKFNPMAFGTGIGNRKITTKPEYRWNPANVDKPPVWSNGNWGESTLGGETANYWDTYQKIGDYTSDDGKTLYNNIKPYNKVLVPDMPEENLANINDIDAVEGFSNINTSRSKNKFKNIEECKSCKKIEWNWILLLLILIVLMIIIIAMSVNYKWI